MIGQGGEFAFVLFALASKLGYLPADINDLLIVTVVASMALTPLLADLGSALSPIIDRLTESAGGTSSQEAAMEEAARVSEDESSNLVVVCGWGPVGRVVCRMLGRKFIPFLAVERDQLVVAKAREQGILCLEGDCRQLGHVLRTNGIKRPTSVVVTLSEEEDIRDAIVSVRETFPEEPVFVRAKDFVQQQEFQTLGATAMFPAAMETSIQLGQEVLASCGTSPSDVEGISREVRNSELVRDDFAAYMWPTTARVVNDELVAEEQAAGGEELTRETAQERSPFRASANASLDGHEQDSDLVGIEAMNPSREGPKELP